jgi:hypothetical protein
MTWKPLAEFQQKGPGDFLGAMMCAVERFI